jgi:peptidyl-prolyl cis-trans isomerase B (cyclophilin B)
MIAAAIALATSGCGGGGKSESALPAGCKQVAKPAPKHVDLRRPAAPRGPVPPATATVRTSCGTFEIALATGRAPRTAGSFEYLVRHHVYDGTAFHHIDRSVIQGGDPKGNGTGDPGYFVDEPPPPNLAYTRGVVAMARTEAQPPGRSGSQFFVVTAADAGLDPTLALLGRVTAGMDVVDRIHSLRAPGEKPRAPVVIERVTVRRG